MELRELRERYRGNRARSYDLDREDQPEWHAEHRAVNELLAGLGEVGTSIVDVPVGTGRFLTIYRDLGWQVVGIDVSDEMLAQAGEVAAGLSMGDAVDLRIGDITALDLPDDTVDVALAIRIANMLELDDLRRAVSELARVARQHVIVGLQVYAPRGRLEEARRRRSDRQRRTVTKPHLSRPVQRLIHRSGLREVTRIPIRHDKDSSYFLFHLTKEPR
jgi:ubiquinone/menaquinone biosynthesis C-methylase UbiE